MANNIQHILVAHDFGETAQAALTYALDLAEKLRARVTVVLGYEIPVYGFPEGLAFTPEVTGRIATLTGNALEGVVQRARRLGVEVDGCCARAPRGARLPAAASAETKADLIVIGTHGRRCLAHALLGRVAEKVVSTAPGPVLTLHGSKGHS